MSAPDLFDRIAESIHVTQYPSFHEDERTVKDIAAAFRAECLKRREEAERNADSFIGKVKAAGKTVDMAAEIAWRVREVLEADPMQTFHKTDLLAAEIRSQLASRTCETCQHNRGEPTKIGEHSSVGAWCNAYVLRPLTETPFSCSLFERAAEEAKP